MESLNGESLYSVFVSGGEEVIQNQQDLNRINVFPVPDGDTGSNLTSTFLAILENGQVSASAGDTMRSMAEQALIGARGNSGIIFAQFLYGLSETLGGAAVVDTVTFGRAVENAVTKSYEAISRPVEGTMLTVIREWGQSVSSVTRQISDFKTLFTQTLKVATRSLKETRNKLKALRDARVVDAGAKAFVHFLQGALNFITTGKVSSIPQRSQAEVMEENFLSSEDISFRYCTETLIRGENLDKSVIRKDIEELGDSVIAAGSTERARVHIHTNKPHTVMARLRNHGTLIQQKADDMIRQQEAVYKRKYPIALVTDSVCDLPQEDLDRYQIHTIPLFLSIGENQYLDKITLTQEQLYGHLGTSQVFPTTSQPNPGTVARLLSFLSSHYESIIVIHLSSRLSGTWSVSRQEADKLTEKKISVIDSRLLSGALGLLVLRAAEDIALGKSHDQIVGEIEESIAKANIFVSVPTLKYMVRGGRVSPLKGVLAKVLNLKPIVSLDPEGNSILYGKAFSSLANQMKIVGMVKELENSGPLRHYAVVHAHCPDRAAEFAEMLRQALGKDPLYIMDISPVVGLNAGLGTVAAVTMKE